MKAKVVKLYNPYHDNLGRFASKPGGKSALLPREMVSIVNKGQHDTFTHVSDANIEHFGKSVTFIHDYVKNNISGIEDMPIQLHKGFNSVRAYLQDKGLSPSEAYNASRVLGFTYTDWKDKPEPVIITPWGLNFMQDFPGIGQGALIAHEVLHGRRRSNGTGLDPGKQLTEGQYHLEEGLTEMLSLKMMDKYYSGINPIFTMARDSGYSGQMSLIAGRLVEALKESDPWKVVSDLHKDVHKKGIVQQLFGKGYNFSRELAKLDYDDDKLYRPLYEMLGYMDIKSLEYTDDTFIKKYREATFNAARLRWLIMKPIPDEEEEVTKLFNPYHDSLGRFASKAGNIGSKVKEHIRNNKGKYLVGGTITAAAIGTAVVHEMGKDYKNNLKVTSEIINIPSPYWRGDKIEVQLMKVGNPKIDKEFLDKLAETYNTVHSKVGNIKPEKVVVTDNYMNLMFENTIKSLYPDQDTDYIYEKQLRQLLGTDRLSPRQNEFIQNIKLGAAHILENKFGQEKVQAFAYPKSGRINLRATANKGTMTHEWIHGVRDHYLMPGFLRSAEETLKYEGLVDAIATRLVPEYKGVSPYTKYRERYLNHVENVKNKYYDNSFSLLLDIFQRGPESQYDIPIDDVKLELSLEEEREIFILQAVLSGYYDLVKDEFERIVNEYIQEVITLEDSTKLFNPYHDSLGRFASKSSSAISGVKEHIQKHGKKYVFAGGVATSLAAIGGAIYLSNRTKNEHTYYAESNNWNGIVKFLSRNPQTGDTAKMTAYTTVAMNELKGMGIKDFDYKSINFDERPGFGNEPLGSFNKHTGEVKFYSDTVSNIRSSIKSDNDFAASIVAHELYHARKAGSKYNLDKDTEEGLATIAGAIVGKRYSENRLNAGEITDKDLNDGLVEYMIDRFAGWIPDKYIDRASNLFAASEYLDEDDRRYSRYPTKANPVKYLKKWLTASEEELATSIKEIGAAFDYLKYVGKLEHVQLFNPYHDNLGRFTSGPSRSSALFGFGKKDNVGISGAGVTKKASQILDRVDSKLYSGTTDPKIVTGYSWKELEQKTGIKSKNFLGAFMFDQNEIVFSPSGLAEIRRQPKLLDRIISHEGVHARKRSGSGEINFANSRHAFFEEGLTDLISLSPAHNNVGYNYTASPYYKQMQAVARAARANSGNDVSRAWQWITQSHYYNDNPNIASSRYNSIGDMLFRGTGTTNDIEWLFANTPRRLEEEFDEEYTRKILQKSEVAKWRALGINLEFDNEF